MADSSIEWTDKVWNPVTGCTKVSAGCANCYAEKVALRFWKNRKFGDIQLHEKRLGEPLKWRGPKKIFVNSMSDLLHEKVPASFLADVFNIMASATLECHCRKGKHNQEEDNPCWTGPPHIFQILTKRVKRLPGIWDEIAEQIDDSWSGEDCLPLAMEAGCWPLLNVWLGVSVEDQRAADERIPFLVQTKAIVRWLSVEPMLGPINLSKYLKGLTNLTKDIHWVVVGGESGPGARPFNVEWARDILAQCRAADVPCFIKQLGAKPFREEENVVNGHTLFGIYPKMKLKSRKGGEVSEWPEDLRVREFPRVTT